MLKQNKYNEVIIRIDSVDISYKSKKKNVANNNIVIYKVLLHP